MPPGRQSVCTPPVARVILDAPRPVRGPGGSTASGLSADAEMPDDGQVRPAVEFFPSGIRA